MSYRRFGVMILASTLIMFGLMYLNTYSVAHVLFSQTRMWMALVMGSAMAAVMLLFMWRMYENPRLNVLILAVAAGVLAGSLYMVRSQRLVGDVAYMRAMVPHHSIAVLTSERAQIRDPRVRALADRILETQVREIAEMKGLIADLDRKPPPPTAGVLPASQAGVRAAQGRSAD